jgi:hypothetical protein
MIIYKTQENGQATDWGYSSKCPKGFKSILLDEKIRKIEDIDKESYNTPEYNKSVQLSEQRSECIRLLNESEIHVSIDPPYPDDVNSWKEYRAQLREILKSEELWEIPEKPF